MRIPYGFNLIKTGALEINAATAKVVQMIFDYYLAGASLGKVVDMLYAKQLLLHLLRSCGLFRRTQLA